MPKYNVIHIVADDLGYGDTSLDGVDYGHTPRIEAFADEACILNRAYAHPVCTASRVALYGGVSPHTVGLADGVIRHWHPNIALSSSVLTLGDKMKALGYYTSMVGKWHLGQGHKWMLPHNRGFDDFYGMYTGASDYYYHGFFNEPDLHHNGVPVSSPDYLTDALGAYAVDLIDLHNYSRPLYMALNFNAPHLPRQALAADLPRFRKAGRSEAFATYLAQIYRMDVWIGNIIDTIKARGQWDNTILLVTSDNGGDDQTEFGAYKTNGYLRGEKRQLYEGGIRIPTFLHDPRIKRKCSNAFVHIKDFHFSALEAGGDTTNYGHEGRIVHRLVNGQESRNWILLHADSVSYAFIRRGIKYISNPLRDYTTPFTTPEAYPISDPLESFNIYETAEKQFFPQFLENNIYHTPTPLMLPTDPKHRDFIPPVNWEPVN